MQKHQLPVQELREQDTDVPRALSHTLARPVMRGGLLIFFFFYYYSFSSLKFPAVTADVGTNK